jgi:hypothetical protein
MVQSAALVGMVSLHRLVHTWQQAVTIYIALTDFARGKFIEGGLPQEKIQVKPNFMAADPGAGDGGGGFALFVGRLTRDKGVEVLLNAWRQLKSSMPLKIVGDGPLQETVERRGESMPNVEVLGRQTSEEVLRLMKAATVLIVPSLWYEGFPMTCVTGTQATCFGPETQRTWRLASSERLTTRRKHPICGETHVPFLKSVTTRRSATGRCSRSTKPHSAGTDEWIDTVNLRF